jgi:hypothetical protein
MPGDGVIRSPRRTNRSAHSNTSGGVLQASGVPRPSSVLPATRLTILLSTRWPTRGLGRTRDLPSPSVTDRVKAEVGIGVMFIEIGALNRAVVGDAAESPHHLAPSSEKKHRPRRGANPDCVAPSLEGSGLANNWHESGPVSGHRDEPPPSVIIHSGDDQVVPASRRAMIARSQDADRGAPYRRGGATIARLERFVSRPSGLSSAV